MPDPGKLLADEAVAWEAFASVLARIPPARREDAGVGADGWSPVTVVSHVAGWLEECARVLEAMADDTGERSAGDDRAGSVDERNREQVARAAAPTWARVEVLVAAARERASAAWAILPDANAEAWRWFQESGPIHYATHARELETWLDHVAEQPSRSLPGSAGSVA